MVIRSPRLMFCCVELLPQDQTVGANSEDDKATASQTRVTTADVIPQGPTNNLITHHDQETQRSYADVVRNNRSAHSIELINKEY